MGHEGAIEGRLKAKEGAAGERGPRGRERGVDRGGAGRGPSSGQPT